MPNTLVIKWHDRPPSEGGTRLIAKVGDDAAPFFEELYTQERLGDALTAAKKLLEDALAKFDNLKPPPGVNV